MQNSRFCLDDLATRAQQGEIEAGHRLYDAVAPHLRRIVRRVVRTWEAFTLLDRRIMREAGSVLMREPASDLHEDEEALVEEVTRGLADHFYHQVTRGHTETRGLAGESTSTF